MTTQEENLAAEQIMALRSGIAAFEGKHFARALQLLYTLAEMGVVDAQYRCAIMAQNGLGMVINQQDALKWMTAAAEQGLALAQHGLGFMYMQGECAEQNDEKAVYWFRLAAEQGLAGAQAALASMHEAGRG